MRRARNLVSDRAGEDVFPPTDLDLRVATGGYDVRARQHRARRDPYARTAFFWGARDIDANTHLTVGGELAESD